MGQCGLHLTVLFGILRQWSISQAPRDSYMCRIIRLFKKEKRKKKVIQENNGVFFLEWWRRYTEQTVNREHDYAIYTLQILPDNKKKKKKKKREKEKKKRGKAEEKWNSDIRLTTARPACGGSCGPGLKKGSCDWSERIRQSGNAAVPQRDNH